MTTRLLHEIARDIRLHWPNVHYAAEPYLQAMATLYTMRDTYGNESASSVVTYFLANATKWRGDDARRLKAELNQLVRNR